ncbi:MAG: hypothetical protein AAF773_07080 [Cyanobacteria bacterium P01_D01_bin.115]
MLDYEMEFGLDGEFELDFETDYEADGEAFLPALASLLPTVAPVAINALSSLMKEAEMEGDFEDLEYEDFEYEAEWETGPKTKKADIVLMNHLANAAADSESEAEAEAFIGALTSLAAKAAPMVAKVAPTLIKGAARVGRQLLSSPTTKQLVRTLPTIAEGTVQTLARQAAQGRPVDSQTAVRALAHNTSQVLRSPRRTASAIRRSRYPRGYAQSYRRRRRRSYGYR